MFITFEGADGCGKTTQARRLADRLTLMGWDVVLTREPPSDTPLMEKLRGVLLDQDVTPWTEALLFLSLRAEHVATVVRPALSAGKVVICDRYIDSTLVYQGYGRGLSTTDLCTVHNLVTGKLWPDVTIVLDVPLDEGLCRQMVRHRFEEDAALMQRVHAGYEALRAYATPRFVWVDGAGTEEAVASRVWAAVEPRLRRQGASG